MCGYTSLAAKVFNICVSIIPNAELQAARNPREEKFNISSVGTTNYEHAGSNGNDIEILSAYFCIYFIGILELRALVRS